MTVTARWPIKGFQSIQVVVDYIRDDKKTTEKTAKADQKTVVEKSVFDRLLSYIGQSQKITEQQQGRQLISGLNIDDLSNATPEMIEHCIIRSSLSIGRIPSRRSKPMRLGCVRRGKYIRIFRS